MNKVASINKETVALLDMIPHPQNPRVPLMPGEPKYEELRNSILKFDYVDPIVWNKRTGHIVGGHQRYTVLLNEKYTHADVSVVDKSEREEFLLLHALNKIEGMWDNEMLHANLETMSAEEMELIGFSEVEFHSLETETEEMEGLGDFNEPDEVELSLVFKLSPDDYNAAVDWLNAEAERRGLDKKEQVLMEMVKE